MTIKTYRTRELKGYSLHLFIGESNVRTNILFKRGCTLGSTATYTTSNPEIQKALESLSEFGPTFYIEKKVVVDEAAPVVAKKPEVKPEPVIEEEKEVVDILVKDPNLLKLGGEEKHITAVFTDIKGFSTFAETVTPTQLVSFLNRYLTLLSDVILENRGTIDKYEGDAIIAFFGAPISSNEHGRAFSARKKETLR